MATQRAYWKESVVYQVYPASFLSTGSGSQPGWGDIKGITSKLDYLKDLGVDIVWSSPFFKSPQVDLGYDISDYKDIDPRYGTLADVDELIVGLKQRDMKLMIDLVVNHTSDQHAWFQESRSSQTNPKRSWYHWQPAKTDADGNRVPPNNWAMQLGEAHSAWTWDESTQEYYLSLFTPEQPDLNWENPDVRAAVHDVLRFWLDRGACGFRMDVINHISKEPGYPDARVIYPDSRYQPGHEHYANGPRLHEFLQEINSKVLSKYDSMTVGEMPFARDTTEILKVIAADRKEINMIFIFDIVNVDDDPFRFSLKQWKPKDVATIISKWQTELVQGGGWPSIFLENHDHPRSVTRFTDDSPRYRDLGAKLLALMQTTLGGTLYLYQGEEVGMKNFPLSWDPSEYKDIETVNYWKKMQDLSGGDESKMVEAKRIIQRKARDHARTPVQWSDGPNAGFCPENVTPWMRVNDDYKEVNVAAQVPRHQNTLKDASKEQGGGLKSSISKAAQKIADNFAPVGSSLGPVVPTHSMPIPSSEGEPLSVWQFWQRGLANRKAHKDVFVYGTFEALDVSNEDVFAYRRVGEKEAFVVLLNFTGETVSLDLPEKPAKTSKWVISNYAEGPTDRALQGKIMLKPWEGLLGTAVV